MKLEDFKLSDARLLQNKLIIKEKVSISLAAILVDNVMNRFDEQVREAVLLWLNDALTDDFAINGLSVGDVCRMAKLSSFEALCFLDIHKKTPDFAKYEISWYERRYDK